MKKMMNMMNGRYKHDFGGRWRELLKNGTEPKKKERERKKGFIAMGSVAATKNTHD